MVNYRIAALIYMHSKISNPVSDPEIIASEFVNFSMEKAWPI